MSLFTAVWVFFLGLALLVLVAGILAAVRRPPHPAISEPQAQVKWQCTICGYVFVEFDERRFTHCPRCGTLLDSAADATVFTAVQSRKS